MWGKKKLPTTDFFFFFFLIFPLNLGRVRGEEIPIRQEEGIEGTKEEREGKKERGKCVEKQVFK